jgi:hypothetical protein
LPLDNVLLILKGKRMERLSLKAEETLWLYPCQFQAAR